MTNTTHIEQMIADLCPNGVEWKRLGEVLDYEQPTPYIVKNTDYDDSYLTPVLTAGQSFILGYTNEKEGIYKASKEQPTIIFDDFTTSFHWVEFDFKVKSSAMKMLRPKKEVNINFRFVYYAMQCIKFQATEHTRYWISKYSQFEIPIPSLVIQERIVEVLDKFSALAAELQAELQLRRKQYEYYRTQLLTPHTDGNPAGDSTDDRNWGLQEQEPRHASRVHSDNNATLGGVDHYDNATLGGVGHNDNATLGGVAHYMPIPSVSYKYPYSQTWEWKTLGEVCTKIVSGGTPARNHAEYFEGTIPWMRTQEVDWKEVYDTEIHITEDAVKNSSAKLIPANCVIIAMYGATAGKSCINKIPVTTNQACCNLEIDPAQAMYKYVYYWVCKEYENIKGMGEGSQNNINAQKIKSYKLPIPPLSEQERIVAILDKFEALTTSLTDGIPAEQAAQQKRYEYYRDKLLSFPRQTSHNE